MEMKSNINNVEIMTKAIKEGIDSESWSKLRLMYEGYCIGIEQICFSTDCSGPFSKDGCTHAPYEFNYWVACNSFVTGSKIDIILRKNESINNIIKKLDSIEEKYKDISYLDGDYIEPEF
tara:strand:- start:2837 stop:3196 length:360 start_codon:yes stop_codon:yes gene_type:complete